MGARVFVAVVVVALSSCVTTAISVSGQELRTHIDEFRRTGAATVQLDPDGPRRLRLDRMLSLDVDRVALLLPLSEILDGCSANAPTLPPAEMPQSEQKICMLDRADSQQFVLETERHLDWHEIGHVAVVGAEVVVAAAPPACAIACDDGSLRTTSIVVAIVEGVGLIVGAAYALSHANYGFF